MASKKTPKNKGEAKTGSDRDIVIDREFKDLFVPLSNLEMEQLEKNLLAAKRCSDPLKVWKEENILLDGHHRREVCKKHNLPYSVEEVSLPNREAALAWIRDHQLGRRNLTPEAVWYLRGKHYNAETKSHGGDRKSDEASGKNSHSKTEKEVGERYKVSARTIRHDAAFAEAVDQITKTCTDELKTALLRRDVKLTRKQVQDVAKMEDRDEQKKLVTKILVARRMPKGTDGPSRQGKPGAAGAKKIAVPTNPSELAKVLLRHLGPSGVERVRQAIAQVLAEHEAKQEGDRSAGKPTRRRKAVDEVE